MQRAEQNTGIEAVGYEDRQWRKYAHTGAVDPVHVQELLKLD
jgi:hypothetical protein